MTPIDKHGRTGSADNIELKSTPHAASFGPPPRRLQKGNRVKPNAGSGSNGMLDNADSSVMINRSAGTSTDHNGYTFPSDSALVESNGATETREPVSDRVSASGPSDHSNIENERDADAIRSGEAKRNAGKPKIKTEKRSRLGHSTDRATNGVESDGEEIDEHHFSRRLGITKDENNKLLKAIDAERKLERLAGDLDRDDEWMETSATVLEGMRVLQARWQALEVELKALTKESRVGRPGMTQTVRGRGRARGRGRGRGRGRWRSL